MAKSKDGRPPRSISAWRSLHARNEMEQHFPALVRLIDALAVGNPDGDTIAQMQKDALSEIRCGDGRTRYEPSTKSVLNERRLAAATKVERLSQDRTILDAVRNAVDAELASIAADLHEAESTLKDEVYARDSEDSYLYAAKDKLLAAGVTAANLKKLDAAKIAQIREIVSGPVAAPLKSKARPTIRRPPEKALAWTAEGAWANVLPKSHPTFVYTTRPMQGHEATIMRRCGLPPFATLAEFGYPHLTGAFASAIDPSAKNAAAWEICKAWLRDHVDDGLHSHEVTNTRERAWKFFFGVAYNFADEVKELSMLKIPSPWTEDRYLLVRRQT